MSKATTESGRLASAAGEHMGRWLASEEMHKYMQSAWEQRHWPDRVRPYICISREAGAGGGEIARVVGQQLGWDVLDKELLDYMAERYKLPRDMLALVDETKANWLEDIFGEWFDSQVVSHQKYLVYLERILWLAATHGRVVLVGRGAQFVLPRDKGLRIRIIAPRSYRARRYMNKYNVSFEEAERRIDEIDEGRRDFAHRFFHHDWADSHLYDLVLNVQRIGVKAVPEQIVQVYRHVYEGDAQR